MSKYDKVYEMLDVVAASDMSFSWSNCNCCLMGIAREEGFFGAYDKDHYVNTGMMKHFLGLTDHEFDSIFTAYFVRPELACDKDGAVEFVREMVAGWETEQAIVNAAVQRLIEDLSVRA